jgi:hypothetical protein
MRSPIKPLGRTGITNEFTLAMPPALVNGSISQLNNFFVAITTQMVAQEKECRD